MSGGIESLFGGGRGQHAPDPKPQTARVIRKVGGEVFVAAVDDDTRHPIGPVRGGAGVPVGAIVLLIWTDESPWIAAWDSEED